MLEDQLEDEVMDEEGVLNDRLESLQARLYDEGLLDDASLLGIARAYVRRLERMVDVSTEALEKGAATMEDVREGLYQAKALAAAGREMREAQRSYFATKDHEILIRSKGLEKKFDELLRGMVA